MLDEGFEPSTTDYKTIVLPLNYRGIIYSISYSVYNSTTGAGMFQGGEEFLQNFWGGFDFLGFHYSNNQIVIKI